MITPPPALDEAEKIPNVVRKAKRVFSDLARVGGGGARKGQIFWRYMFAVRMVVKEGAKKTLLGRDDDQLKTLPRKKDCLTLIRLASPIPAPNPPFPT